MNSLWFNWLLISRSYDHHFVLLFGMSLQLGNSHEWRDIKLQMPKGVAN